MGDEAAILAVSINPFGGNDRRRLEAASRRLRFEHLDGEDAEALSIGLVHPDVEVLLASWLPDDLERVPKLKWLQVGSVGVAHLDLAAAERRGIVITNAKGLYSVPIAEFVIGALVAIARDLPRHVRNQIAHHWGDESMTTRRTLRGARIAIVGYGGIGREVGRLARTLGMEVIAAKRNPEDRTYRGFLLPGTGDPDGSSAQEIVSLGDLPSRLADVDFLVVALPDAPSSRSVVGSDIIEALPPHAWLINVGRGQTVDDDALQTALRAGRVGGAFLDVATEEPLPPASPYWDMPNVIITPHISGRAVSNDWFVDLFAENLRRYATGEPLLNVVDSAAGY